MKKEGPLSLAGRFVRRVRRGSLVPDQNLLYKKWIDHIEKPYLEHEYIAFQSEKKELGIKISILMPVYNAPVDALKEAVDSVKTQWYENWELCMYDDASTSQETLDLLKELSNSQDPRIKVEFGKTNQNISAATNAAFDLSTGDYLMLMDNDDRLMPNAFHEVVKVLSEQKDLDLIYFDEDKLDKFGERIEPYFKPDFSHELMWSMMYPTHAVYSRKLFEKAGKMRKGFEGSQDYDLALRVMELTDKIHHIPWVLYHWRKVEGSTAVDITGKSYAIDAAKKALSEALSRRGFNGKILGEAYPFLPEIEIKSAPTVEIIIPFKDKLELLEQILGSIWEKTTYANYSITLVDNQSTEEATADYLKTIESKVKIIKYDKLYNFSAINNFAAKQSEANFLIFLNNDTKILTESWIEGLLMWAQQKEVGAVGCKLIYPDRTIQHAGILLGVGGVANHAYYRFPEKSDFYFNNLNTVRNYSALTAACMMVERRKFVEVGMFNEDLPGAFNDVDLSLKLTEKGYRNVFTPQVEIVHFESKSRDPHVSKEEDDYMYKRWGRYIENDPYYNPHLSRDLEKAPTFSL